MPRRRRGPRPAGLGIAKARPLLVIELDCDTLDAQGLAFGETTGIWSALFGIRVRLIRARNTEHLRRQVRALRQGGKTYRDVFVVSHSSVDGVDTGPNEGMAWADLGALLSGFRPARLVLLACDAGRTDSARALFAEIPGLEELLASPVKAWRTFGLHLIAMLPAILRLKGLSTQMMVAAFNGAMVLADGGHLGYWTRANVNRDDDTSRLMDLAAERLDPLRRKIADSYGLWMNRLFPLAQVPVPRR